MNPATGYTNHLAAYQTPKGRRENPDDLSRPSNCYTNNPKYAYVPYSDCLTADVARRDRAFDGSGEIDERKAWRCPDCGAELQDVMSSCCGKCGSCEPAEYR